MMQNVAAHKQRGIYLTSMCFLKVTLFSLLTLLLKQTKCFFAFIIIPSEVSSLIILVVFSTAQQKARNGFWLVTKCSVLSRNI